MSWSTSRLERAKGAGGARCGRRTALRRARWEDGHTSTLFPGPGAVLKVTETEHSHHADLVAKPELGTMRQWNVRVTIFEKGDDTTATVALLADSPEALTARGTSHRDGADPGWPTSATRSPWPRPCTTSQTT